MDRIAVFPYNHDCELLCENEELIKDYTLSAVILSSDYLYDVEDKKEDRGISYSYDINALINQFDSLYLCDNISGIIRDSYREKADIALKNGKTILLSNELKKELGLEKHNRIFPVHGKYETSREYPYGQFFEIDKPVVAVMGQGGNCDKLYTQILLKKFFDKEGIKADFIASSALGSLFGMDTLPSFLYENELTFEKKIIKLNHYLYDLSKEKDSEVLVIGFPGGIMPFNEQIHNHFCEFPIIISSAVRVDISILNLYLYKEYGDNYFDDLINYCTQKYRIPIDYFCISRQNMSYDEELKKIRYYYFDRKYICENIKDQSKWSHETFHIVDNCAVEAAFSGIVDTLSSNLDTL